MRSKLRAHWKKVMKAQSCILLTASRIICWISTKYIRGFLQLFLNYDDCGSAVATFEKNISLLSGRAFWSLGDCFCLYGAHIHAYIHIINPWVIVNLSSFIKVIWLVLSSAAGLRTPVAKKGMRSFMKRVYHCLGFHWLWKLTGNPRFSFWLCPWSPFPREQWRQMLFCSFVTFWMREQKVHSSHYDGY